MDGERDYPVGHPAASDYKGTPFVDKFASYAYDFPEGHPARGGKNVSVLDTPDGAREATVHRVNNLTTLAEEGALPPLFAPGRKEPLPLTAAQLAHLYAARKAYDPDKAPSEDAKQAVGYITALGYDQTAAISMFLNYAQPPKAGETPKV
jgi:hypothetical protein